MNWQEVANKNINALSEFTRWAYCKRGPFSLMRDSGNQLVFELNNHPKKKYTLSFRELYDFFDEQGLKVVVSYNPDSCQMESGIWENRIYLNGVGRFNTRTEAEEQAFLRAFQILEEKLREGR